jgi:hypothetical protein
MTILGEDGQIHGQASPSYRSGSAAVPPTVSTSNDAVYYLDGDSKLMMLKPDGTATLVRNLPGTPSTYVVFAVSPDDARIAIALLAYGPTPSPGLGVLGPKYLGMKLYVENIDGTHHVDLFSSSTSVEWPIGWHGADLVVAVNSPSAAFPGAGVNGFGDLPYIARSGLHVVEASTGVRKATICPGLIVLGLATTSGILCASPSGTVESDWAGHISATGFRCDSAQLQPGGSDIACSADGAPSFVWTSVGQQPLPIPSGGLQPFGPESFRPVCWVGHDHLLLESRSLGPVLLDMGNGSTRPINVQGDWAAGAIPGAF